METKIFDGKIEAQKIKESLKKEAQKEGLTPSLAVILVGDDPSSQSYIKQKQKACENLGWHFELHHLPASSTFEEIKQKILLINHQSLINGLILQLPLPASLKIPSYELTGYILPAKDIDGLTPPSKFTPPTALAVEYILNKERIKIDGAQIVIYGRGPTAGQPIASLLFKRGAKIYVVHSQTDLLDAKRFTLSADIVVSCVGHPHLINGEMIKEGAVVIGVGMAKIQDSGLKIQDLGKSGPSIINHQSLIVGDLNEPSLLGKAKLITPTPGGVGPLTVAFLLKNLLRATQLASRSSRLPPPSDQSASLAQFG